MIYFTQEVMGMYEIKENRCPICGEQLKLSKLVCPDCGIEFPVNQTCSPYDRLSPQQSVFLTAFLRCRGNLSDLQTQLNISYPTAKKKLDDLLTELGLYEKPEEESPMLGFQENVILNQNSLKASDIIRNKLYENGGRATVYSVNGKSYVIKASYDKKSFSCDQLPHKLYSYTIFDIIVDLLLKNGGKAPKGNGRSYRLGEKNCTEDTVVGTIAKNYEGRRIGESVFDPVFVLAAVLDWAGIAHNERGYIELTASYRMKLKQ